MILREFLEKNASYATGNTVYIKPIAPISTFCE